MEAAGLGILEISRMVQLHFFPDPLFLFLFLPSIPTLHLHDLHCPLSVLSSVCRTLLNHNNGKFLSTSPVFPLRVALADILGFIIDLQAPQVIPSPAIDPGHPR